MRTSYDIIVVGGGHAGCEAAAAAAALGSSVLLITMDMGKFAQMSCNPAIGGVAKGQIVREIDALGGQMGIITDLTTIQFRMLNRSKGPAMWSPRAQCDKEQFSAEWRRTLETTANLWIWQDTVTELVCSAGAARGVRTRLGVEFSAGAVILTAGTFLNGLMHVGSTSASGGRHGDQASYGLTECLVGLGFEAGRMKTGTPARLDARSINFEVLEAQYGDDNPSKFSFLPSVSPVRHQEPCFVVNTSREVHDVLRGGFADSPLFNGIIKGVGPRYCPSIEDKLRTFAEKDSHQLFLEPEGRNTCEYYLNGFSSSLPWQVQFEALRMLPGFGDIQLFRPGYAIEYDYFPPTQLLHSLETKLVSGLWFAGQINGTTGYEEAAAQGLMAGINAHLSINGSDPIVLGRDQAYIGVLIDDLVTKGVDEPYRMFTSRAEYRILLRQDNADLRLTPLAVKLGLASPARREAHEEKTAKIEYLLKFLHATNVTPELVRGYLEQIGSPAIAQNRKLYELILRNEVTIGALAAHLPMLADEIAAQGISEEVAEQAEIQIKYKGYIEREKHMAGKLHRLEAIQIPFNFDFEKLLALSTEARQKLSRIRPTSLGQASRIPGVSPSDINVLLVHFGR